MKHIKHVKPTKFLLSSPTKVTEYQLLTLKLVLRAIESIYPVFCVQIVLHGNKKAELIGKFFFNKIFKPSSCSP